MPQYYFRRRDTPYAPGEHPHDLPDLGQALIVANRLARRIVRREPASPAGALDVETEDRRLVARVMFADVMRQIS